MTQFNNNPKTSLQRQKRRTRENLKSQLFFKENRYEQFY